MERNRRPVEVWDAPVRLFHWAAAGLLAALYVTWRETWMAWHALAGEILLALVLFRLLWGFFGSDTARFARFVAGPGAALRHLRHLLRREPDIRVGHNPAGGWMVLVLLGLLLGEALTGLYIDNDVANDGPLTAIVPAWIADLVTILHAVLWDLLLAAVALHLLAILIHAVAKRHDLVRPMLTGRKWLPADMPSPRIAPPALALLLLGCAGAAVALLAGFL